MLKPILATLLAASTLLPTPVLSITQQEVNAHNYLLSTLKSLGIKVGMDSNICQKQPELAGFYYSIYKTLIICNKGQLIMNYENADTLRHEAVHAAQDCMDGVIGNSKLEPVFLPSALRDWITIHQIDTNRINRVYGRSGHQPKQILLEIEAFAASKALSAYQIAAALKHSCKP